MAEYHSVPDADDDAFRALVEYAFCPENGPFDPAEADPGPDHEVGEPRGYYDGGDLLAVCRHYGLATELRESVVDAGGVGTVASEPGRRREGNVRELLAASLAEYRDRGRRLALLWPFDIGFYRALGWATVSKLAVWEVAPDDLAGLAADGPDDRRAANRRDAGFERLTADDWERLVPVQVADHADADLAVRRTEAWWREFVFDRWDERPFVYAWVGDGDAGSDGDSDVRGYLVYHVAAEGDERVLVVREQAARDVDARRQLFRFCRDHDSQVDRVRFYTTPDAVAGEGFDPHRHLDDPGAAEATVRAGAMGRLVDVVEDLPAVVGPAADGVAAEFDLAVDDPLAGWNDGRFRVATTAGSGLDVDRVGGGVDPDGGDRPTVRLGVGPLSQVAVGSRSVEELTRAGAVAGGDDALAALGDCFPPRRTLLRENF
ncbi:MAG: enhanced intracellular survival protein Eis [Halolamina sp.]